MEDNKSVESVGDGILQLSSLIYKTLTASLIGF
ncbi:hypothetical protein DEU39_3449 [Chryseobacterium sp. AG363]|nr:hypothetical protein DEU39_3449 [Chryseobacterium sp. AG363]